MKKLSIEQKAKAYDEAIERAKGVIEQNQLMEYLKKGIEYIFPELKESEDEQIREYLIRYIDNTMESSELKSKLLAWLERQDKGTSWKPSKEEMDVLYGLSYITNQYDEHKEEVITRLYQDLKREFFNGSSYENMFPNTEDGVRRRSTIQVLEYARSLDNYNQYGKADIDKNIAWLEKQGEQETIDKIQFGKKYKCIASPRYSVFMKGEIYVPKDKFLCSLMNLCYDCFEPIEDDEKKPTDKVEPKFKVGDWIVHQGTDNIYQVVAVIDNQYQLKYGDNYTVQKCVDVDRCARLWDITKDAKDGAVLACENGWTCIFKTLVNDETFSSYCFMDNTKWFCETGSECHTLKEEFVKAYNGKIYPATKEQRDLLFQKMKEAGYTFDFEKKELKEIEQKPVFEMKTPEESLGIDPKTYK